MNRFLLLAVLLVLGYDVSGQGHLPVRDNIDLHQCPSSQKTIFWLSITESALGQALTIPVIVLKGKSASPVLGITAAIHGDEVNGTAIIHKALGEIDMAKLQGTIIAFPVLNPQGMLLHQRGDLYGEDLNRIFPGKPSGTESEQFVWALKEKILPHLHFLIDIHTASFGRANTLYVRANLQNDTLAQMAKLLQPDIVLDSRAASAGIVTAASKTLRQEAEEKGIYAVTLEAGNPQVIQKDMSERGAEGVLRVLDFLNIYDVSLGEAKNRAVYCRKSYWLYTAKGGILEVMPDLNQRVKKGELIAVQRDLFGNEIQEYRSPEDGIVIGKSTNPIAAAGGRILHLGIER